MPRSSSATRNGWPARPVRPDRHLKAAASSWACGRPEGAIEDFSIDPVTLEPMNITIGNVRPKGICGSGLITAVATMFEMGIIDNLGKFNRDLETPRIRQTEGIYEYVLAWKEETQIDRDVVLTEPDIDNLIRAKGRHVQRLHDAAGRGGVERERSSTASFWPAGSAAMWILRRP